MGDFSFKAAETSTGILDSIANRWSPYAFDGREVEAEKLKSCFEAARWAASSFNEQPWRFILTNRTDAGFESAIGCLMEANQTWARESGALIFTAYRTSFTYNGSPNRVALHDLGQAAANFSIQATELGLQAHQMGGINPSKIRQQYQVPEEFEIGTAIAVGYADANPAQEELGKRDAAKRERKALSEIVFGDSFGNSAGI